MDVPDTELDRLEHIVDGQDEPQRFQFALLRAITDKFSDAQIIGRGGCGVVYKGVLRKGTIAVKKLFRKHVIDEKMFEREVNSMMMIKHNNIVRFLGYCSDTQGEALKVGEKYIMTEVQERLLCFEYIKNGSLQNHITDEFRGLNWHERYQIIEGICKGLYHLHKEKHILHMGLKPDNILLDDGMVPKITDFGFARLDGKSQTTSKDLLVSLGYCAPEYLFDGKMSSKLDIYSLGVIILELVTGSKADPNVTKVLRRWRHRWKKSSERPTSLWYRQVIKCLDLAQLCKRENPIGRPDIEDIIRELNEIDTWNGRTSYATVSTFDEIMSTLEDMLGIEPLEMHLPFALNQQIPFSIKLTNDTGDYFGFSIKTTSLLHFSIEPEKGVVPPQSSLCASIALEAQNDTPLQNHCNEFWVRIFRIDRCTASSMDVTRDMFNDMVGKVFDEVNLTVVLDIPQADIDSINCQEADKESGEAYLIRAEKVSLRPSSQVFQGSRELMAPMAPDDTSTRVAIMDRESYLELESILQDIKADRAKPRHLPFEFLEYITNNFSPDLELGRGGFGVVYKGLLKYGEIVVVKRLRAAPGTLDIQYENEAHLLSLKHKNIVRILGFCSETRKAVVKHEGRDCVADILERLICLEYMPNGSLDHRIKDVSSGLNWDQRLKIIMGICCGLCFLHDENQTNTPIIHLDLKPANILLTNEMVPKITDFGLSRFFGEQQTRIYTKNNIGTRGYMAPEFVERGKITKKSDIFSFGVIVLEMITGNRDYPWSNDTTTVHQNYVETEVQKWRERMMEDLRSTFVERNCTQIKNCIEIGLKCVNTDEMKRPTAKEIIESLNRSLNRSNITTSIGHIQESFSCMPCSRAYIGDADLSTLKGQLPRRLHLAEQSDSDGLCKGLGDDIEVPTLSELHRKLVGEGSHRRLVYSVKFGASQDAVVNFLDACDAHLVVIESLPNGVFADPFELQHFIERKVFRDVAVFGDTNLELPSALSNRSVVEVHVDLSSSNFNLIIDLPLHARYPPLDASGYANVEFGNPDLFLRFRKKNNIHFDSCMWAVKNPDAAPVEKAAWRIPCGDEAHIGLVSSITFLSALVCSMSIVIAALIY